MAKVVYNRTPQLRLLGVPLVAVADYLSGVNFASGKSRSTIAAAFSGLDVVVNKTTIAVVFLTLETRAWSVTINRTARWLAATAGIACVRGRFLYGDALYSSHS